MINFDTVAVMWGKYLFDVAESLYQNGEYNSLDDVYDSEEWMNNIERDLNKIGFSKNNVSNITYCMATGDHFGGEPLYKLLAFLIYRKCPFRTKEELISAITAHPQNSILREFSDNDLELLLHYANKYLE